MKIPLLPLNKTAIPTLSLKGKTALVTGSRRGIGRAIALAYAEAGANVAVCDAVIDDGHLAEVAEKIRKLGRQSIPIQVDITRRTEVESLIDQVTAKFKRLDILFNNAAIDIRGPMLDLTEENWDKMLDVNLKGTFLVSQAAARKMVVQKHGVIISMASQLAFKSWNNVGPYCISKAGIVMLTRILARELGPMGIRVNAIAPSSVRTELGRPTWSDPARLKQIESGIPYTGRLAEPEDLIGPALFLASDAAGYISGHTILVDAGTNA